MSEHVIAPPDWGGHWSFSAVLSSLRWGKGSRFWESVVCLKRIWKASTAWKTGAPSRCPAAIRELKKARAGT